METSGNSKSFKVDNFKWLAGVLVLVALIGAAAWHKLDRTSSNMDASEGYQAVFLTNGQVYFGKLSNHRSWLELTDIYYLQVTQNLQQASTAEQARNASPSTGGTAGQQPNIQLVKLGSELHGPQDTMYIDRDKILFWENMKDDSKVVQAIKQYQEKNK